MLSERLRLPFRSMPFNQSFSLFKNTLIDLLESFSTKIRGVELCKLI